MKNLLVNAPGLHSTCTAQTRGHTGMKQVLKFVHLDDGIPWKGECYTVFQKSSIGSIFFFNLVTIDNIRVVFFMSAGGDDKTADLRIRSQ